MSVVEPRGHGPLVERLFGAAASGRLPHALTFEGREGIGRFLAARYFAAGLLCARGPARPCGECGPCKRFRTANHADLFVLDPVEEVTESIKLERVALRDGSEESTSCLEAFLDLRALEGELRPVLVREAHRMTDAAQNALLKTLEEPRPGTVLVLETHRPERLLPTILSRCVRVRFDALSADDCAAVLSGQGLTPDEAQSLTRWSEGAPGRALRLARSNAGAVLHVLERCARGELSAFECASEILRLDGDFTGATPSAILRSRTRFALELELGLLRDAARHAAGVPLDELAFGLEAARLAPGGRGVQRALDEVLVCRGDVDRNLAPEAVLERALLSLADAQRTVGAR